MRQSSLLKLTNCGVMKFDRDPEVLTMLISNHSSPSKEINLAEALCLCYPSKILLSDVVE